MGGNLSNERRSDRNTARRDYTASLMSNSKWRAVFVALEAVKPALSRIDVKFVGTSEPKSMRLPWLQAPHAFVDSFEFGPFPLIGIEWIEVPSVVKLPPDGNSPAKYERHDIDAVWSALRATGKQLPLIRADSGLRIVGHQI